MTSQLRKFMKVAIAIPAAAAFVVLLGACGGGPVIPPSQRSLGNVRDTPEPERELSGSYKVSGTDSNNTFPYTGALEVNNEGAGYHFRWTTTRDRHDGVGVQMGDTVGVSYASGGGGKGCGVILYKIASDGSLDGRIAKWGEYSFGSEKAVRTEGSGFAGKYTVTGTTSDGKDYTGTLSITKDGGGYDLEWKTDKPSVAFGIWKGGRAAASFGGAQCGFAIFSVESGGDLEGRWGGQRSVTFGTETAKRQ